MEPKDVKNAIFDKGIFVLVYENSLHFILAQNANINTVKRSECLTRRGEGVNSGLIKATFFEEHVHTLAMRDPPQDYIYLYFMVKTKFFENEDFIFETSF